MSELEKKKKFSLPSTPVLLFLIIVVIMILTYIIPAGTYERVFDEASGRNVVDPASFQYVEQSPVNPWKMFVSIPDAFVEVGNIIFLIAFGFFWVYSVMQSGALTSAMFGHPDENGVLGTWVGIAAYTLQIYFDFSGYSDMACGLGNMLGFEFLKNFDYPYISKSITDFWRRWHISLSTWFKEYVYIPLGGNRKGMKRQIINLLIVWGLTGLWHGASYNFIFWGLYYGGLLILEKFVLKKWLDRLPTAVQHIYTIFIVMIGWGLFYFTDVGQLFNFMGDLFNFGNGLISQSALSLTLSYLPIMIIAGVASTPLAAKYYARFSGWKYLWIAETAFCALILFVSTACLVRQSYNPFLYFRF